MAGRLRLTRSVCTHSSAGSLGPFYFPEILFHAEGRYPKSLIGKNFCAYLLELRNSSSSFKGIRKALIDTLLDGYENARYGTGVSAGAAAPGPAAAQGTVAVLRLTARPRSRCHRGHVSHGLFRSCPGLWETGISEVPGRSERAGKRVSVTAGGAAGERWWLPGPQQLVVEV